MQGERERKKDSYRSRYEIITREMERKFPRYQSVYSTREGFLFTTLGREIMQEFLNHGVKT